MLILQLIKQRKLKKKERIEKINKLIEEEKKFQSKIKSKLNDLDGDYKKN